jgi:hypothetical protein
MADDDKTIFFILRAEDSLYHYVTTVKADDAETAARHGAELDSNLPDGESGRYLAIEIEAMHEFDIEVETRRVGSVVARRR